MKNKGITEYFEEVELNEEYDGYFYSVADVITIVILEGICGLKNVKQIHRWAASDRVSEFLSEKFRISHVPCYIGYYVFYTLSIRDHSTAVLRILYIRLFPKNRII
jgi:hypothetical protein